MNTCELSKLKNKLFKVIVDGHKENQPIETIKENITEIFDVVDELPFAEPYKIKMVEQIFKSTKEQREGWIEKANFNLFNLKSKEVFIDLLTDSGTCAMSDNQWGALMVGDESYAGSSSYYKLKDTIFDIFGFPHFIPTHQGRGAEHVLFKVLIKKDDVIPGNSHFDTTKAHIKELKAKVEDLTVDDAKNINDSKRFKGNVDITKLKECIDKSENAGKIPFICMTITNGTVGGQPVSMKNLKEVKILADEHQIPVLFDSARFAENAYFIKTYEDGYNEKSIKEIVKEMYNYADFITISAKKDALVNIGGFIAFKDPEICKKAILPTIMYEGYTTYGGLSGRDMEAMAIGLDENTEYDVLHARIHQVEYLAECLCSEIPYWKPSGGHAIFINAEDFLKHLKKEDLPAHTLCVELYLEAGIRCGVFQTNPLSIRLAISRRAYTDNHMKYVAEAVNRVYKRRLGIIKGLKQNNEKNELNNFTATFDRC